MTHSESSRKNLYEIVQLIEKERKHNSGCVNFIDDLNEAMRMFSEWFDVGKLYESYKLSFDDIESWFNEEKGKLDA